MFKKSMSQRTDRSIRRRQRMSSVSALAFRLPKNRIADVAKLAKKAASDLAMVWPLRALVQSTSDEARVVS